MRNFVAGFFCPLVLLFSQNLSAQFSNTLPALHSTADSLRRPAINWTTIPAKRVFPYKSYILPASLVVYGVVSLNTKPLQYINKKVKEEIYTEPLPPNMHIDNYLQYSSAVAVYALNAAGFHGKNNFRDRTMIYAMSSMIMCGTIFTVKKFAGETRPDGSDNLSFPSGHTANAFANAEFIRQEFKDVSPWYGIAGYAVAATTGYLRISNNRHWMSDVAAGAGIGIISSKLAYWMYPVIKRKIFKDKEVKTMVMPSYQNGTLAIGMVHHF